MKQRIFLPFSGRLPSPLASLLLICGTALASGTVLIPETGRAQDRELFFETRIRPVLAEHCHECHGAEKSESDLRLDHISFLQTEGNYGTVLKPGKPEASTLFTSLAHTHKDLKMPEDRAKLPEQVVADFRKWIQEGAYWPEEPVARNPNGKFDLQKRMARLDWIWKAPAPVTPPPHSKSGEWPRTTIDRFILRRLQQNGLTPAPDADPASWLRRAHFVITGLPPTPQQLQSFLQRPDAAAQARVVDQLLDSPHFGEKWARHWMDLVRYSESRGHESDFHIANAWHYRDYLIRALNADVPYDQFVREHIAGDLLPQPRTGDGGLNESVLATGWPYFGEEVHSPVDIRQDEYDRLDNKVDVFSKTFLGLTVACARCHDHKFDAISQRDYYSLAGYFLSARFQQVRFETELAHRQLERNQQRILQTWERGVTDALHQLLRKNAAPMLKQIEIAKKGATSDKETALERFWKAELHRFGKDPSHPLRVLIDGRQPIPSSESLLVADFSRDSQTITSGLAFHKTTGLNPRAIPPAGDQRPLAPTLKGAGFVFRDSSWNSLRLTKGVEKDSGSLNAIGRSNGSLQTPTFQIKQGKLKILMEGESQVYAAVNSHLMIIGPLHQKLVSHLKAPKRSWVQLDLGQYIGHRVHLEFGTVADKPLRIWKVIDGEVKLPSSPDAGLPPERLLGELKQAVQNLLDSYLADGLKTTGDSEKMAQLLNWLLAHPEGLKDKDLFDRQIEKLAADYRKQIGPNPLDPKAPPFKQDSLVAISMFDGDGVDIPVLKRGKPDLPGETAPRQLPSAFMENSDFIKKPATEKVSPSDPLDRGGRLQLANQVASPDNPLTARVRVNRIWHHVFGRGLVPSVDNFGWLGERPSHPELLDYLAYRFSHQDAWSTKTLIRELVLSHTFAMTSSPSNPNIEQQDPNNRLLHRMSVRRLDAELIRDNLLAVSGRLDPSLFGKPIPVHLTEFVVGRGRPGKSGPLDGQGRRSIYTAVRRNFLPTLMTTFDFPIPFSTVGRRNTTNVPAQSLALLNDPLVYQQAEFWADRLLKNEKQGPQDRIRQMYLECFSRLPEGDEIRLAQQTLQQIADQRQQSLDDRQVWIDLCHTFFSLNEFIYLR
ncbi:MAG: PSD1 and planctomycete cytochrome C domain-containing protein [Planctomycetota bacterium]|nr:PSD1 and planctomycete cytochrome C domain-containing protein [Planctomycetota bacterium]